MSFHKRLIAAIRRAKLRERLFAAIGRAMRPEKYTEDASGHEHKGKGPGGGQFTSGSGGGEGRELDKIGSGSSGDVFSDGHSVYKKATGNEAEVYSKLRGIPGVADGEIVGGNIVTPKFKHIISVDDVPLKNRKTLHPVVAKSLPKIVNAVNALSAAGYDYNDPLQIGLDANRNPSLFDFSAAQKSPTATLNNLNHLSNFLSEFGLDRHAAAIRTVRSIMDYADEDSRELALMGDDDDPDAIDARFAEKATKDNPNGLKFAYYSFNARTVPGVSQTGPRNGANVVFSDKPLSSEFMSEWELNPAVHPYAKAA